MKKQMAVLLCLGMAAALPFGVSADETEEKEPVHLLVARLRQAWNTPLRRK